MQNDQTEEYFRKVQRIKEQLLKTAAGEGPNVGFDEYDEGRREKAENSDFVNNLLAGEWEDALPEGSPDSTPDAEANPEQSVDEGYPASDVSIAGEENPLETAEKVSDDPNELDIDTAKEGKLRRKLASLSDAQLIKLHQTTVKRLLSHIDSGTIKTASDVSAAVIQKMVKEAEADADLFYGYMLGLTQSMLLKQAQEGADIPPEQLAAMMEAGGPAGGEAPPMPPESPAGEEMPPEAGQGGDAEMEQVVEEVVDELADQLVQMTGSEEAATQLLVEQVAQSPELAGSVLESLGATPEEVEKAVDEVAEEIASATEGGMPGGEGGVTPEEGEPAPTGEEGISSETIDQLLSGGEGASPPEEEGASPPEEEGASPPEEEGASPPEEEEEKTAMFKGLLALHEAATGLGLTPELIANGLKGHPKEREAIKVATALKNFQKKYSKLITATKKKGSPRLKQEFEQYLRELFFAN